jgi:hypothetical protein
MIARVTVTLATVALLAGCASIVERTQGAPEWFDAKAREVRGEGYPKLREVPTARPPSPQAEETQKRADTLKVEFKSAEDAAAAEPIATPDEIRARAAQLRAKADETARPGAPPLTSAAGSP